MISAAVSAANEARCGLAFIHTHPGDRRPPQLSSIDQKTTLRLGVAFDDLVDGPFASLVVSPGGWGGTAYKHRAIKPLDRLATVGRRLCVFDPTQSDALASRAKVSAVADGLRRLDLGTALTAIDGDVLDGAVQARLLNCDVVIGATEVRNGPEHQGRHPSGVFAPVRGRAR